MCIHIKIYIYHRHCQSLLIYQEKVEKCNSSFKIIRDTSVSVPVKVQTGHGDYIKHLTKKV